MTTAEALDFSSYGPFAPIMEIILMLALAWFIITIEKRERQKDKEVLFRPALRLEAIYAIVLEEILFRGIILLLLLNIFSPFISVIIGSVLYGLWELRNVSYQTKNQTIWRMLYNTLIFGPAASSISILSGHLWIVMVFHYLHNLIARFIKRRKLGFKF